MRPCNIISCLAPGVYKANHVTAMDDEPVEYMEGANWCIFTVPPEGARVEFEPRRDFYIMPLDRGPEAR